MSACRWLAFLIVLPGAGLAGQQEPGASPFTCPMHPRIRIPKDGACPICGMPLVPDRPRPEPVEIGAGELGEYCETYLEERVRRREGFAGLATLQGYEALFGERSVARLRGLLGHEKGPWRAAAAHVLGARNDRESIPVLLELLKEPLRRSCRDHPDVVAETPGGCPHCGRVLTPSGGALGERMEIAGALHRMGRSEGQRVLADLAEEPFGWMVYPLLAQRDTPGTRRVLAAGAASPDRPRRAMAVAAQLGLGIDGPFDEAVSLLEDLDRWSLEAVIRGVGASGLSRAREPLQVIVRDDERPYVDRILAAAALVELGERGYQGFLMDAWHKREEERPEVCAALGEVGDERTLPLLERAIETDPGSRDDAVAAAARVLGRTAAGGGGR